ncbi:hypothetical protein GCM10010350_75950 [Streptomyces galilaeus]|nr:hypothetical protein GCM10010350_75950 [Streptomyces galilaeus]
MRALDDGFQACTAVRRQLRTWASRSANCKAVPHALPFLDTHHDVSEPVLPVVFGAANHNDRAVRSGGHGQADRAQEHFGEVSEPSGPEN